MGLRFISAVLIMSLIGFESLAQEQSIFDELREEEQSTIEAIALYPENERKVILVASTHPELLVRIQNMQVKTSAEFRSVIDDLDEEDQKKVFNVTRYPDLVADIVAGNKKKTKKQMDLILEGYPDGLYYDAISLNKNNFAELKEINYHYQNSQMVFEEMITDYPLDVREAYRRLLELPEIMDILADNLNLTLLLGDYYKKKPAKLLEELDSLNVVVAEQKTKELNEWIQTLEDNPEAKAEYEKASREFGEEQGYDESEYSERNSEHHTTDVFLYRGWHSYSYWFGCPMWYPYDCWYPYPWWYHCGYYYGPGRVIVYIGIPSSYYIHWHFHNHAHLYHYPHFTHSVISYHQHHPHKKTNFTAVTDSWIKERNNELPRNWFNEDNDRVNRIKEYGKFNMDYEASIRESNNKIPTRREYLESHTKSYPTLKGAMKETNKPHTVIKDNPEKKPVQRPEKPIKKQPTPVLRPQSEREKIERAKKHHENTWSVPRPQRPPVRTNPPVRRKPPTRIKTPVPKRPPVRTKPSGKN